jgi:hypothetical protein
MSSESIAKAIENLTKSIDNQIENLTKSIDNQNKIIALSSKYFIGKSLAGVYDSNRVWKEHVREINKLAGIDIDESKW